MANITKSQKLFLSLILVLIILSLLLLLGKVSYSFLAADVDDPSVTQGEVTASGDVLVFSKGNSLSLSATTDNFNSSSENLTATTNPSAKLLSKGKDHIAMSEYFVAFTIKENTYQYSTENNDAELILTIHDSEGEIIDNIEDLEFVTINDVSGFDITEKIGSFQVASNYPISTVENATSATQTWSFTLTFVNFETDQSVNEEASLAIDILLQKDALQIEETLHGILANQIIKLYTAGLDKNIYYHDNNLENGANDNSYRYAGLNPNNYVCFGFDDETKNYAEGWCPENNLYRIIGIFNEAEEGQEAIYQTKLIKNTEIGKNFWSGSADSISNVWAYSSLNTEMLNITYLNNLGEWKNKVSNHKWKVGGINTSIVTTAKQYYDNEVGATSNNTTYEAKVGLMYVSDIGYANLPEKWDNDIAMSSDNWLIKTSSEWTISRSSNMPNSAFGIAANGNIINYNLSGTNFSIRPTIYLDSTIELVSGNGTATDPYRIN